MQESRDALVKFIQAKLSEKNLAPAVASKMIGKNHAYLQQFIGRSVPRALPEETRSKLARLIGVDETCLKVSSPAKSANLPNDSTQPYGNNTHVALGTEHKEGRNMGEAGGLTDAVLKSVLARLDRIEGQIDTLRQEVADARSDPQRRRKV